MLSKVNNAVSSTQTEIIAVHTPKDESKSQFPYRKPAPRPSSLPLAAVNNQMTNCPERWTNLNEEVARNYSNKKDESQQN